MDPVSDLKILILGASGMLGHKLYQHFSPRFVTTGTIRGEFSSVERFGIFDETNIATNFDVLDAAELERRISKIMPDVVINAIGIVKQVPTAKDIITTLEINSILPNRLAEFGAKYGYRLIAVSTDCVFDGVKGSYNENDVPNATDLYGKSKNLGEVTGDNCLTIRSSIIGRELATSHSLVEWFLSNRGGDVAGFTTAIYSGFPTIVFADIIESLIVEHKELSGLYHVAAPPINKFELLQLINRYYDADIRITPSDKLVIDRSLDGSRFNSVTGFVSPDWETLIKRMANDETPYDSFRA